MKASADADTHSTPGAAEYLVANTHSMEPALWGNDIIIVDRPPFDSIKLGDIILDHGTWQKENDPPECHRAVAKDIGGILVEGDNVDANHLENRYRVTDKNYIGKVERIYRVKP